MAFQLQAFKAYGIRCQGATRQQARQVAQLHIVQANTDTAVDVASDTAGALGTFWTAATGDAVYGALAAAALAKVQAIAAIVKAPLPVKAPADYVQVSSAPAGKQYVVAVTAGLPSVTLVSGSAPTDWVLTLEWTLQDNYEAIVADLGANF